MCRFGDIYYAQLPIMPGSQVQQGIRPVLVVSNDKNNMYSPVVTIVPMTSKQCKHSLPTHVAISGYGLLKPSVILGEQIISLDKKFLRERVGTVIDRPMRIKIQRALMTQLNLAA